MATKYQLTMNYTWTEAGAKAWYNRVSDGDKQTERSSFKTLENAIKKADSWIHYYDNEPTSSILWILDSLTIADKETGEVVWSWSK